MTPETIHRVKSMLADGVKPKVIAQELNIYKSDISRIKTGNKPKPQKPRNKIENSASEQYLMRAF